MRADLLDAQAAVDWAVAQIPILQQRFIAWQGSGPYELIVEPDSDPAYEILVARQLVPLDPLIGPDIGAVLNATRSALDLLASALATRNSVKPDRNTHFPIYKSASGFLDPKRGIDSPKVKKWLSSAEIATIKSLKPYDGGDAVLYALNELDILRKHERLIVVYPSVGRAWITVWGGGIQPVLRHEDDKTILYRFPARSGFRPAKGNSYVTPEIFLNEPALRIIREPAVLMLRKFAARVSEIIGLFDAL